MIWIKLGGLRLGLNWKDYDKGKNLENYDKELDW